MKLLKIFWIFFFVNFLHAQSIELKDTTEFLDILPSSQVYIDHTKKLGIEDVFQDRVEFKQNNESLLGYGFSPDFNVWIKFTLENRTDMDINKVLEYANPITTHLEFYDVTQGYLPKKDGLFTIDENRKTINPTFAISVKANSSKTYYLKASSHITTLIIKLNLWSNKTFYEKEIKHQSVLALFFGSMIILGLYNLFIFFFIKDISYLFYFLYLLSIIIHHCIYRGIGVIHLLNQEWIFYTIIFASFIASSPVFALGLFTKTFLQTKNYPRLDFILNILLVLLPISVIVFISTDEFNKYRNILGVSTLAYLLFITVYATFKKNRQAYFILIGWCAIFLALLFMLLSSIGVFDIYSYFPYFIEASLVFEAVIFSLALADRIKQLQQDKESFHRKLISQKESERKRLAILVDDKTHDLKIALEEKNMLFKELHHRVKNNMQIIISLIRLQKDDIESKRLKEILTTTQNRISTMKHLHEMLYQREMIYSLDTKEYFNMLIEEIKYSYLNDNITIETDIQAELEVEQAIYCGIMLNELITNSFKYAFDNKEGNIKIALLKENGFYILQVIDNGIGYDQESTANSLGLILVTNLAKKQLRGDISVDSSNGVEIEIKWKESEKS